MKKLIAAITAGLLLSGCIAPAKYNSNNRTLNNPTPKTFNQKVAENLIVTQKEKPEDKISMLETAVYEDKFEGTTTEYFKHKVGDSTIIDYYCDYLSIRIPSYSLSPSKGVRAKFDNKSTEFLSLNYYFTSSYYSIYKFDHYYTIYYNSEHGLLDNLKKSHKMKLDIDGVNEFSLKGFTKLYNKMCNK